MKTNNLTKFLPFLAWFPLSGVQVRADILAGITVALVLIPQSMAYAQLAGMPAYYGLYASFLPVIIGALWGSSRQLATGPVAVVSLLTASALAPLAITGSEQFIMLAILLAFLVGIIQIALGVFRLGAIVNLLSHPVIIGFTNAAAIIIALSQFNKLLGVPMDRSENFLADLAGVISQVDGTHLPTLAMGVSALVLMLWLKRYHPKVPNVLVAVALATTISWAIGYEKIVVLPADKIGDSALQSEIHDHIQKKSRLAELEIELGRTRDAILTANNPSREDLAGLEYQFAMAEWQRDEIATAVKLHFKTLREMRFVIIGEGSEAQIYSRTNAPPEHEGQIWRLKRISDSGLHLSGGGDVVGSIPPGLPSFTLPTLTWSDITNLLSAALVISLVAFMEAISIAKAMAAKTRARIDPNQELIGQGLANIASGASQGFPVSGSFSRSAVNLNAGAVSGLSSVVTGLLVLVTLLFLTGLLYHLPQAVLAAVIMLAVVGLVNFGALRHAWLTHRHDGIAASVTFVATLAFAPHLDKGILFGAVIAIVLFLRRRMRPRGEILAQHPDGVLAGMDTHQLPPMSKYLVPVRFDGELTFVNVTYFEDMVLEALSRFPEAKAILLIGSSINEIDVSGEEKIADVARRLEQNGVKLYISGLKHQVMEVLERAHIHQSLPADRFFRSKEQAIRELMERYDQTRQGSKE
jgi:sulfate permease, SulP family